MPEARARTQVCYNTYSDIDVISFLEQQVESISVTGTEEEFIRGSDNMFGL
jgi:hypothetical protein